MDIIAVGQIKDGFQIKTISIKEKNMNEIVRVCSQELAWFGDNFELFECRRGTWYWVARHTGRGWVRIALDVKYWEKYATPSWIARAKKIQALMKV